MKKTIVVAIAVLLSIPVFAAITYPVTIMDFEVPVGVGTALVIDSQTASPDAVKLKSGTGVISNIGVTSGVQSLELSATGSAWQTRTLGKGLWRMWDALKTGTAITMDVTVSNPGGNTLIPDQWLNIDVQIAGTATGWANYMLLGSAIPILWDQSTTQVTCVIPQALRDMIAGAANTNGDMFITRSHGAGGATYWIDNVQIVPEPATMMILALGGLMALKKRK